MKYTIYQDPITRQCAHLPLPSRFVDGDPLPAVISDRWFESPEAAIAALAELLDHDEGESPAAAAVPVPMEAAAPLRLIDLSPRSFVWRQH